MLGFGGFGDWRRYQGSKVPGNQAFKFRVVVVVGWYSEVRIVSVVFPFLV